MKFRPCIDLHQGIVKQIVGSTLTDNTFDTLKTNFISKKPASWFAEQYKKDKLKGGHIIQLGNGNEKASIEALEAFFGGMQIGGGINLTNAKDWLDYGASAVILTSWIFHDGIFDETRAKQLVQKIGKQKIVLDLSCRKKDGHYWIVTNRWQTFTQECLSTTLLEKLSLYANEFLIHAVDVEGKCQGIETSVIKILGNWGKIPMAYAGGISTQEDIDQVQYYGKNQIDFTVGSALDIFGGNQLSYKKLVHNYGY